jgi:ATP-binding cassette subfamily C protein LapB
MIDLPLAALFLGLMIVLAGPALAMVVLAFLLLSLLVGMVMRKRILSHTAGSIAHSNMKWGLLVQSVEGIETLKSTGAGWQFLNRWNALSREALTDDLKIRRLHETGSFIAALLQQLSYVSIIAIGAWMAITHGAVTTGTLVACSILSGRVLAPVGTVQGLVSQWAFARISLDQLDALLALRRDNDQSQRPITPARLDGHYVLDRVSFAYPGQTRPIRIERLEIQPGERVGIIGSIGSGKSTLLKIFSGLYPAQSGLVLLDGLDLSQISRSQLAELSAFLPQDPRLFAGTLRENLLHGLVGVREDDIFEAAKATGLSRHLAADPRGLDQIIGESGNGLSRGQRQLVFLTRLLLHKPQILLLDEPTSGMDDQTEVQCLGALQASLSSSQTMVLVTHRPRLLDLVTRVVVMTPDGIVLDGPKLAVLKRLRSASQTGNVSPGRTDRENDVYAGIEGHE